MLQGQVYVAYKDAPLRHATELYSILRTKMRSQSILYVYTDGGPDHRLTYVSVQLSLIALFRKLNLDLLIAGRTAPCHSWKNPVERIMSIVNLGLQCVGMMRKEGSANFERSVNNIRKATSELKKNVKESLTPPTQLLRDITGRLKLKDKNFLAVESADDMEIDDFWSVLLFIDSTMQRSDSTKSILSSRPKLKEFLDHCCQIRHYSFCIKKCGNNSCTICRMDAATFSSLKFLPDPVLGEDGHYLPFSNVYEKPTTEKDRPSLKAKKQKSLSYSPSKQHATNVGVVIQCEECSKWRLMFSKRKLSLHQQQELRSRVSDLSYSCGATMEDVDLPDDLQCVEIRSHCCSDLIERLYYSAYPEDVLCIHCGETQSVASDIEGAFPYCEECESQPRVYKRKKEQVMSIFFFKI